MSALRSFHSIFRFTKGKVKVATAFICTYICLTPIYVFIWDKVIIFFFQIAALPNDNRVNIGRLCKGTWGRQRISRCKGTADGQRQASSVLQVELSVVDGVNHGQRELVVSRQSTECQVRVRDVCHTVGEGAALRFIGDVIKTELVYICLLKLWVDLPKVITVAWSVVYVWWHGPEAQDQSEGLWSLFLVFSSSVPARQALLIG